MLLVEEWRRGGRRRIIKEIVKDKITNVPVYAENSVSHQPPKIYVGRPEERFKINTNRFLAGINKYEEARDVRRISGRGLIGYYVVWILLIQMKNICLIYLQYIFIIIFEKKKLLILIKKNCNYRELFKKIRWYFSRNRTEFYSLRNEILSRIWKDVFSLQNLYFKSSGFHNFMFTIMPFWIS